MFALILVRNIVYCSTLV